MSRTSPGMTLKAGLPTSTETTSRLVGSKSAFPWSSGGENSAVSTGASARTGFSAMMGIGGMALAAADRDPSVERAAPAVLDRVADRLDGGRFAEDAMVETFALAKRPVDELDRAVDRRAFLVASQEEADRALKRAPRDEAQGGGDARRRRRPSCRRRHGPRAPHRRFRPRTGRTASAPCRPAARRRCGRRRRDWAVRLRNAHRG